MPPAGRSAEPDDEVSWGFPDAAGVYLIAFLLIGVASSLLSGFLPAELARGVFFPLSLALLGATTIAWVAVRHREQLMALFGRWPTGADLGMGLGHGVAAFLVINLGFSAALQVITRITGGTMPEVQETLREAVQDGQIGLLVIVSAVVVAPIAEELFFRGLLFQGVRRALGPWPGIGISAFLFGLAHYQAGNLQGTLYAVLVLTSFGMYLAWVFDRRRSIATPILMHATFNGLAVAGILLAG